MSGETISFDSYGFRWELEGISLEFCSNDSETIINYYKGKKKFTDIGHMHVDNEEVIDMINEINRVDKMVKITATFLGSSFEIVDKTAKRKKSWFFVRRYYSC